MTGHQPAKGRTASDRDHHHGHGRCSDRRPAWGAGLGSRERGWPEGVGSLAANRGPRCRREAESHEGGRDEAPLCFGDDVLRGHPGQGAGVSPGSSGQAPNLYLAPRGSSTPTSTQGRPLSRAGVEPTSSGSCRVKATGRRTRPARTQASQRHGRCGRHSRPSTPSRRSGRAEGSRLCPASLTCFQTREKASNFKTILFACSRDCLGRKPGAHRDTPGPETSTHAPAGDREHREGSLGSQPPHWGSATPLSPLMKETPQTKRARRTSQRFW